MKNNDIAKIENLKNREDTYIIRWQMTTLCNYKCDFCIQGNQDKHIIDSQGENPDIRKKICDKLIKFIEEKLNNKYKKVRVYLVGGEVTILKDFIDILSKIVNVKFDGVIYIHITSNLSCNKELLLDIKNVFKGKKDRILSLSASYYKAYTTEKEFIDKIKLFGVRKNLIYKIENKLFSKSVTRDIILTIGYPLADDRDYDEYIKFKQKYSKYCNNVLYIVIRNYKKSISNELKKELNCQNEKNVKVTFKNGTVKYYSRTSKVGFDLTDTKAFNPKGFECDSGINNISIDNMGNFSKCHSCASQTRVGNIELDDLDLLHEKVMCPITTCNCDLYHCIENIGA